MTRIFPDYTYGPGPRGTCWWDETCPAPDWPRFEGTDAVDVAIVGGGFTGLTAALRLAEAGSQVAVFEAGAPGWGASGRNGGFCCLGGGRISNAALTKTYGADGRRRYRAAEKAAVAFVEAQIDRLGLSVDRHSQGETLLAHSPAAARALAAQADENEEDYGVPVARLSRQDLPEAGLGRAHYGAKTTPIGFALNPRKYLFGLAQAARSAGVRIYAQSPVTRLSRAGAQHDLTLPGGQARADAVLIATNGYSSEDVPDWLGGRYMPTQSSVIVTRPLTDAERAAAAWTSHQMVYDTLNMLHYFRLMPDNRMLFGARGGLRSSAASDARATARVRRDFDAMFPEWRAVETPHAWSGMVCLSMNMTPYIGPVPGAPGLFAALAYHGNGVSMGSYAGHLVAGLIAGAADDAIPAPMSAPMARWPLGRARRLTMYPAYAAFLAQDFAARFG